MTKLLDKTSGHGTLARGGTRVTTQLRFRSLPGNPMALRAVGELRDRAAVGTGTTPDRGAWKS
jgi:hypothetical protein